MAKTMVRNTELEVIQGDITALEVDIIVNAANSGLRGGGGVDGAIHRAGGPAIMAECDKIREERGGCPTGEAVITTAGKLKASYVIHTVGPIWQGGRKDEESKLRACYRNSLKLATQYKSKSIAFPNISTGVYGYPKEPAAAAALTEVVNFLEQNDTTLEKVYFVCFDSGNYQLYRDKLKEISGFSKEEEQGIEKSQG